MKYKLLKIGVLDTDTGTSIKPGDVGWNAYLLWLRENVPDPMDQEPSIPIATRRDLIRTKLLANERDAFLRLKVTLGGFDFIFSQSDLMLIQFVTLSVLAGNSLPVGFGWRDIDGVFHSVTQAQLANVLQKLANSGFILKQQRWTKQDTVAASENPEGEDITIAE